MTITKFGHCCLLIEVNGQRLLTDPGSYSKNFEELENLDAILITHEHGDHLHIPALKQVLANNPQARVTTNHGVAKLLDEAGIAYELVEDGQKTEVGETSIEGHGTLHAEIWKEFGQVLNTGYFVAGQLFYPGDAFYNPGKPVDILALPVAGPWVKLSEAIEYALEIKPRVAFPVHDGVLKQPGMSRGVLGKVLPEAGIEFMPLEDEIPCSM